MKKVLLLLGVVGLLAVLLFVLPKQSDRIEKGSETPDVILPGVNAQTVKKFSIDRPNQPRVVLHLDGTEWRVDMPGMGTYPAEGRNVEDLFRLMSESRVVKLISTNPANHSTFEVDDQKGITLTFEAGQDRKLGEVIVGKLAFNFKSNYVRLKNANEVYELGGDLRRLVDRDADAWRDRTLLRIEPAQVAEVVFEHPGIKKPIDIKRSADGPWSFSDPADAELDKTTAESQAVNKILNQFSVIIARNVEDTTSATDLKSFGLEPPRATVKITDAAGKVTSLKFGAETKDQNIAAMREGSTAIYNVPKWIYETLTPTVEQLRSPGSSTPTGEVKAQKDQKIVQERAKKSLEKK